MIDFQRPLFQPQRTEPCFCGSGKRFKACCGSMAEAREAPHGVHIVRNYLPAETCRQWTQHFEGQPRRPLAVHSLLLYLNQEFEGGELYFQQFNYTYRPGTGDLLFFPSHGHYAHQALPVKSGIRYVVVSWAAYRDEPRVLEMRPEDCIDLEP